MTRRTPAEILREDGPLPGVAQVGGVTWDGASAWLAAGDRLAALDPERGEVRVVRRPGRGWGRAGVGGDPDGERRRGPS